jgi:hypothetical protein
MKTIFIDIADNRKEISGFLLSNGYNFRQIDFISDDKNSKIFVVEAGNKREERALKAFILQAKASVRLVVENGNKAGLKGKKLGIFQELLTPFESSVYYLDRTTGKKYVVDHV